MFFTFYAFQLPANNKKNALTTAVTKNAQQKAVTPIEIVKTTPYIICFSGVKCFV